MALSEAEISLGANGMAVVEVKGKKICLAKHAGEWFGCAYKCPHAGGLLHEGYLDGAGNVVCPTHRYRFSLRNGRNTSGEGFYLKTYPVKRTEEGLFVGLEEGGFLSWL